MPTEPVTIIEPIQRNLTIAISGEDDDLQRAFRITEGKLIIPDSLSWPEYANGMSLFKSLTDNLKLYRSQYVAFGHLKFGKDRVNNCMAQLEFEMDDVRKDIEIASIPASVRRDSLKAEHYTVLARAGIKTKEQAKWAGIAATQNLTPGQLKASIAAGEVVTQDQARSQNSGILTLSGISMELETWLRRAGGLEELRKKPADQREMLAGQIKIACDIYAALTAPARKARKRARKARG